MDVLISKQGEALHLITQFLETVYLPSAAGKTGCSHLQF